ncbi:hypothetical protein [Streptomyces sp. 4N124]
MSWPTEPQSLDTSSTTEPPHNRTTHISAAPHPPDPVREPLDRAGQ